MVALVRISTHQTRLHTLAAADLPAPISKYRAETHSAKCAGTVTYECVVSNTDCDWSRRSMRSTAYALANLLITDTE